MTFKTWEQKRWYGTNNQTILSNLPETRYDDKKCFKKDFNCIRDKFRNFGKQVHKIYNKIKNQIRNGVKISHAMTKSLRFHIDYLYGFVCQASNTFGGIMWHVIKAIHSNHNFFKKRMSLNYFLKNFKKYDNCFETRDFFMGINKTTFDCRICDLIKELIEQGFKTS